MADRAKRCEGCRFWERDGETRLGECHRNPPVAIPLMLLPDGENYEHALVAWPELMASDWCGEWKPKE